MSDRLIIGAAQLGQAYGRGVRREPPSPPEAEAWYEAVVAAGARGIDTARAYGDSEAVIGRVRTGRPGPAVITKIRPLAEFDEGSDPAAVERAVRESLAASFAALRADAIDTVLLHRARDLRAGSGRAAAVLEALRRDGVIIDWGVSVGAPDELLDALDGYGLGHVQLPYNLLDRRWCEPDVVAAIRARPEVMIAARSTYLQGILVDPLARDWPGPSRRDAIDLADRLGAASRELGRESLRDLALGYVLGHPWVGAVVVGARSAEQVADTARLAARPPLTPVQLDWLRSAIPAGPLDLVDPSRWKG
ncbi:aldo/keto reductase [Microlunatus sp. GCM10028923]|uniref:aldo/keto reductase n=1 Tax=Microlunatus sp. GCM10028923 TaxID=3273400 RepID=UPI003617D0C4